MELLTNLSCKCECYRKSSPKNKWQVTPTGSWSDSSLTERTDEECERTEFWESVRLRGERGVSTFSPSSSSSFFSREVKSTPDRSSSGNVPCATMCPWESRHELIMAHLFIGGMQIDWCVLLQLTSFKTRIWFAAFRYCSWWVTKILGLSFRIPQIHLQEQSGLLILTSKKLWNNLSSKIWGWEDFFNVFERGLLLMQSPRLHLIDHKYRKNSNNVKNNYNLK